MAGKKKFLAQRLKRRNWQFLGLLMLTFLVATTLMLLGIGVPGLAFRYPGS